jgi:uncharacterized protein YwlG (UPF0340 family)
MRYNQFIVLQEYIRLDISKTIVERIMKRVFVPIIIMCKAIGQRGRL